MTKAINTSVRVRVTVEVEARDTNWGDSFTLAQVFEESTRGAMNHLRNVLTEHGDRRIRIIGDPEPLAVITPQGK